MSTTPSSPTPSPLMKTFLVELNFWIEQGRPCHSTFSSAVGVCGNLNRAVRALKAHPEVRGELQTELYHMFIADGLDPILPFNTGMSLKYETESEYGLLYENQERINWIKKHAQ